MWNRGSVSLILVPILVVAVVPVAVVPVAVTVVQEVAKEVVGGAKQLV